MKITVKDGQGIEYYEVVGLEPGQVVQVSAANSVGESAQSTYTAPAAAAAPDAPSVSD
jgi:hypothetical protein